MRSLVARLAASLMLGVVTTAVVAWSLAWLPGQGSDYYFQFGPRVGLERTFEMEAIDWGWTRRAYAFTRPRGVDTSTVAGLVQYLRAILAKNGWSPGVDPPANPPSWLFTDDRVQIARECGTSASGWPLRSFRTRITDGEVGGGLALQHVPRWPYDYVPLLPYWPGLLADSLLFGAAWLLIWETVRFLLRLRRARSGRCPRCDYSLTGLAPGALCPECGTGAEPPAAARS